MDLYLILKCLHVFAAIVWVGGGLFMTITLMLAGKDPEAQLRQFDGFATAGAIMMPASLTVLVSGILLTWTGAWGLAPWIVAALIGTAASFVVGGVFLGPGFARIGALRASGDTPAATAVFDGLMPIARAEQVVILAVVLLMVIQPGWTGVAVLTIATVAAVALILATQARRHRHATPA